MRTLQVSAAMEGDTLVAGGHVKSICYCRRSASGARYEPRRSGYPFFWSKGQSADLNYIHAQRDRLCVPPGDIVEALLSLMARAFCEWICRPGCCDCRGL